MFVSWVLEAATGGYLEVTNKDVYNRVLGAATGGYLEVINKDVCKPSSRSCHRWISRGN